MRILALLTLLCGFIALSGCESTSAPSPSTLAIANKPYPAPGIPSPMAQSGPYTLRGRVKDENGRPIPSVSVYYYGTEYRTNDYGIFSIPRVNAISQRVVVQFRKAGYFPLDAGFLPIWDDIFEYNVALSRKTFIQSFQAALGAIVKMDDLEWTIPASAFYLDGQLYTGKVNVFGKYLNTQDPLFYEMMPGNDMQAVTPSGQIVTLASKGAFFLEAWTPEGQKLTSQDGSGKTNALSYTYCINSGLDYSSYVKVWVFSSIENRWVELTNLTYNPLTRQLCFTSSSILTNCNLDYIRTDTLCSDTSKIYLGMDYCSKKIADGTEVIMKMKLHFNDGTSRNVYGSYIAPGVLTRIPDPGQSDPEFYHSTAVFFTLNCSESKQLYKVSYYFNDELKEEKTVSAGSGFRGYLYYTNRPTNSTYFSPICGE